MLKPSLKISLELFVTRVCGGCLSPNHVNITLTFSSEKHLWVCRLWHLEVKEGHISPSYGFLTPLSTPLIQNALEALLSSQLLPWRQLLLRVHLWFSLLELLQQTEWPEQQKCIVSAGHGGAHL